jgi:transposase
MAGASLMHRRRVLKQPITYVGLDVHKDTVAVALAEAGKRGEVREHGKIANTPAALKALSIKLARSDGELRFCYEAGPCGYGIQRQLSATVHECVVVAPSLIPRKPGDRIKTDRRDAINLAKLHRAGELTSVWVPDQAHEAIRNLVRARLAAVRTLRQARQQLSGFLLRHGHHYSRPAWTLMHRRSGWSRPRLAPGFGPAQRSRGRACLGHVGRYAPAAGDLVQRQLSHDEFESAFNVGRTGLVIAFVRQMIRRIDLLDLDCLRPIRKCRQQPEQAYRFG